MRHNHRVGAGGKEVICRTEQGEAIHCSCCGCMEITLGNAVFSLGEDDLSSMLEVLESFSSQDDRQAASGGRCYLIRTQNDDAAFVFNAREVQELKKLASTCRRYAMTGTGRPFEPDQPLFVH